MVSRLGSFRTAVLTLATGALLLCSKTVAQSTNATCILSSVQWASNSHGDSPCSVASSLLGVCYDGAYNVSPLPEETHYLGPASIDDANPCQCNTVVYSLISACGLCQNRTIARWSEWSTNCASVSIDSYPESIPQNLLVPGWAYLDVKSQDIFNEDLAQQNANATESTALPQSTSTSTSAPTSTSSTTSSEPTSTPASASSSASFAEDDRRNKIGGGIVGGVLGLSGILVFFAWLRQRRRNRSPAYEGTSLSSSSESGGSKEKLPTVVVSTVPVERQSV